MRIIPTRKLTKHQTTKNMIVIVIKIQQSIVGDISNKKQMRHQVVPKVFLRQNVQGIRSHYIIRKSPSKDAMHVILKRMVVLLDYSIIMSYDMLMQYSN